MNLLLHALKLTVYSAGYIAYVSGVCNIIGVCVFSVVEKLHSITYCESRRIRARCKDPVAI